MKCLIYLQKDIYEFYSYQKTDEIVIKSFSADLKL